ncbi:helix-turn-helix domain-containing protein [Stutzerimonas tarimensis]|uniref:Helix-turn-helix domain-containing protein n=1 Tax=Stutzerimonas tarimensis TaxID=1507735 RepID=A0ABV7T0X4_9GAMM
MNVQVIMRDGEAEYAVLPWVEYQALLQEAGRTAGAQPPQAAETLPRFAHLAELRQRRGLSVEELARAVGISPAYLQLIEEGQRDPGDAIRYGLARALGINGWEESA